MKFSYKILLWSIIIMAAAFGASGYFFVNYVFDTSIDREVGQALDESSIIQFAFETAALNIPTKYGVLQNSTIEQIGLNLESGGQGGRLLRISDESKNPLYTSEGFAEDMELLMQIDGQSRIYQVIRLGEHYYVQTGTALDALDRILYLETMLDVTEVFEERAQGFSVYRRVSLVMLVCSSLIMFLISFLLTKPIRILTTATKRMADGDYSYRAERISNDEMGQLTTDFNQMAGALEENVGKLENEIRAREDFIAAFSHELKTPLTSIIGYADVLRSRKLDDEKHFMSANYIYTEGKRLETMAFRLLDIIVTKRVDMKLQKTDVSVLFQYLQDIYAENKDYRLLVRYDAAHVDIEVNLIKTVLLNLVDNACKASEAGMTVEITGRRDQNGYLFSVRDYGVGIPEEECRKITEAFYMVDKSRSRSRNGAGLGLALCEEILHMHHSELNIVSKLGEGSCISFLLPMEEVADDAKEKA